MNPTLRRYAVRQQFGWGVFVIGSDGYFSVVSDYGNYAFWWTAIGERDFRKFLLGLDNDYLCSKLAQDRQKEYQSDRTVKGIKEYICQGRRDGTFTAEAAREEWDLLEDGLETESQLEDWYSFTKISDAWEYSVYDYPNQLRAFCKNLWPLFRKTVIDELDAEAGLTTNALI